MGALTLPSLRLGPFPLPLGGRGKFWVGAPLDNAGAGGERGVISLRSDEPMLPTLTFAAVLLAVTALADAGSGRLRVPQSIVLVLTGRGIQFRAWLAAGGDRTGLRAAAAPAAASLYCGRGHELAWLLPQHAADPAACHRLRSGDRDGGCGGVPLAARDGLGGGVRSWGRGCAAGCGGAHGDCASPADA